MKAGEGNGKFRVMAEINMIPLIDVSLVLLIIFMVMTPIMMRAQVKVNLPVSGVAKPETPKNESITVQVDKTGAILIDGRDVQAEDLVATLGRLLHDPESQPLLIEADKEVPFQRVVTVMDAGKKAGVTQLGVCVMPERGKKPQAGR